MLRGFGRFQNTDRPEHQSIDCMKGRGIEKEGGWCPTSEVTNGLRSTMATFKWWCRVHMGLSQVLWSCYSQQRLIPGNSILSFCFCLNMMHGTQAVPSAGTLISGWWLTSQQQASVSQGWICSDNFTCCHTKVEIAGQTFYLTQSQYTDTGLTSPSSDPITPGAWQGSQAGEGT